MGRRRTFSRATASRTDQHARPFLPEYDAQKRALDESLRTLEEAGLLRVGRFSDDLRIEVLEPELDPADAMRRVELMHESQGTRDAITAALHRKGLGAR